MRGANGVFYFAFFRQLLPIVPKSILGCTVHLSVDMIFAREWVWAQSALHQPPDKPRRQSDCRLSRLHFNAHHIKHRMMNGVPKKRTNLRIKAFPVSPSILSSSILCCSGSIVVMPHVGMLVVSCLIFIVSINLPNSYILATEVIWTLSLPCSRCLPIFIWSRYTYSCLDCPYIRLLTQ